MFPLLIALVVFALAGIAATALLRKLPAEPNDLKHGLAHLAGLRWRDFARLVLQAMQARGYQVMQDEGGPADGLPTDGGDILLQQGSQRTLLSCKYGNASVVGAQSILGLGKSAELRGAHSAIVVSPGRFDDEARRVAAQQHVELIDGDTLAIFEADSSIEAWLYSFWMRRYKDGSMELVKKILDWLNSELDVVESAAG